VTFAEGQPDENHLSPLRSFAERVTIVPLLVRRRSPWRRYARNLGRALRFVHRWLTATRIPACATVQTLLEDKADWVWLEHLWVAPYVARLRCPVTTILDLHNVESDYYRQLRGASGLWMEQAGYYVFEKSARRLERRYLPHFDHVLAVSAEDKQLLSRDVAPEKVHVVPNAVQVSPASPAEDTGGKMLYFAGRLDYPPNEMAVLWFHRHVWPLIRARRPDVKWTIVGSSPELLGHRLRRDPHIVLAGRVEGTEPYLRSSSVVVVPITAGGGTRFKILEAWAAAKPVISTTAGARGLAARHGDNIWIADTPQDFCSGVLRLLSEPALRAQLGARGRETVEEHYSLQQLREAGDCASNNPGTRRCA
jgi:glycosyltransferase involved in cell wall biosynthesis